jgi:ATP-dependent DNA helicase PIF1
MVTAMTGSAASHIGGSTLHSATGIRVEKGERSTIARAIPKKAAEWCNVRYLIIDEVSMIDRDIVMRLEIQLQLLTSNATAMLGGMNILFCGDFLQFPCCSHLNVYDGGADLLCSKGHDLWRSLNAGVILRQQMCYTGKAFMAVHTYIIYSAASALSRLIKSAHNSAPPLHLRSPRNRL